MSIARRGILTVISIFGLYAAESAFSASWTPGPNMTAPRHDAAVVQGKDNMIYAIGGWAGPGNTYDSVDVYNGTSWSISPYRLPARRSGARGVVDSTGRIWIMGGGDPTSNTVLSFQPGSSSGWQTSPYSMNSARSGMGVAITPDDTIYVFGGGSPDAGGEAVPTAEKSVRGGPWTRIASMSVQRYLPGYVYYNGYIYAIGGQHTTVTLRSAERLNIATGQWEMLPNMPGTKSGPSAFVYNGEIYVVGGWGPGMTNSCYVFNPSTKQWRSNAAGNMYAGFTCGGSGIPFIVGGQWSAGSASNQFAIGSDYYPGQPVLDPPTMTSVTVGSSSAFLEWTPLGDCTYKVYVWQYLATWGLIKEITQDRIGQPIRSPKSIVDALTPYATYAFAVTAIDSTGKEYPRSLSNLSQAEINTLKKGIPKPGKIFPPLSEPIVLVPGVGSQLEPDNWMDYIFEPFFPDLRIKLREFGWSDAQPARVKYGSILYTEGNCPNGGIKWRYDEEGAQNDSIFTFVPYTPLTEGEHEIGIAQKGIELGYFLSELSKIGAWKKYRLMGHSLGGLTCRAYVQRDETPYAYNNNVTHLVTIGTPNNGVASDCDNYPVAKQNGLKGILLDEVNGYLRPDDSWRLDGIYDKGWDRDRAVKYLKDLVAYLEATNWDFAGTTLMEDVLHNSNFLKDLNQTTYGDYGDFPLMKYTSLMGEVKAWGRIYPYCPWIIYIIVEGVIYGVLNTDLWNPGGNNSFLGYETVYANSHGYNGGDGVVSCTSQDLKVIADGFPSKRPVLSIKRPFNHEKEAGDYIGLLMGLGYPVLSIQSSCPVDLEVYSPNDEIMAKNESGMFMATYQEIMDASSSTPEDLVEIPFPDPGEYEIYVKPEPGADLSETFTLTMNLNGVTTVLAENQPIPNPELPPFFVPIEVVNSAPTASAGEDQTVDAGNNTSASVTLDGSGSSDPDNNPLFYSWTLNGQEIAQGVQPIVNLPLGVHTITLIVNDGYVPSEPDTVMITVTGNNPPTAVNDAANTTVVKPVTIPVLANDSDSDGQLVPGSVTIVLAPANGTAVVNTATGAVVYTPAAKFIGTDSFKYTVKDDDAAVSNEATVTVTVKRLLGDVDLDGDVDNADLNLVMAAVNKPVSGPNDPRDIDGDGKITVLDVRKLVLIIRSQQ